MVRKVFKAGNSLVVSLPRESLEALGLVEGSEILVEVDAEQREVIIRPAGFAAGGVDETFARQVSEFIEQYGEALEALAR